MFNAPVRRDRRRSTAAFLLTLLVNGAVIAALSSVRDAPAAAAIPDAPMERYYPVVMPKLEPRGGSAPAPKATAKSKPAAVPAPEPVTPTVVTPLLPDPPVSLDAAVAPSPGDSAPKDGGGGGGRGPGTTPGLGEGPGKGDGEGGGLRVVDYDAVRVRSQVSPEFPQAARALNLPGDTCVVRLDIDTRGRPTSAVASGCSEIFAEAAEEAALKWRFAPLFMDGHAIPARFSISFRFRYN